VFLHVDRNDHNAARARRALDAIESGSEWLLWVSRSGRVVDASPALCRLLNYSFNEILNLSSAPIDDLPETWDKRWQDFGLYLTETFPTNLRSKSGDLISVSTEARLCTGFETGDPCVLLRLTSTILRSVSQPRSVPTLPPSPFFEAMSEGVAFHRVLYNADHVAYDYEILDVNSKFTEIVGKFTSLPSRPIWIFTLRLP